MNDDDPWRDFPRVGETPVPAPSAAADPWAAFPSPGSQTQTNPVAAPIAGQPQPPDKYRQAAIEDRNKLIAAGITPPGDNARLIGQGAGLGWTDELLAGLETPIQMFRRGTWNLPEAYRYAKANQDLILEKSREQGGALGTALELAGGLATGAGVAGPATRIASPAANYWKGVGVGGGLGAVAGAGEAPDVSSIPANATLGGVLGLGVGAVAPAVPYLIKPFTGRLRDPEKMATEFVAEKARMAKVSPEQIVQEITDAAAANQPYNIADVLGKEGRRGLVSVAKVPGEQRDLITQELVARDINQPYRLQEQLGLEGTADAAARSLRQRAKTEAAPFYRQAEDVATYSPRIQEFLDDPISQQALRFGVKEQRVAAVGDNIPFNPTHAALDAEGNIIAVPNVRTLQTLKIGLDRMIEANTDKATGEVSRYGRALIKFKNGLTQEMGDLNPAFAEANRIYAGPMQVADAIKAGRDMATRGRYQDTIPAFEARPLTEQEGVRIGLFDKVLEQAERSKSLPTYLQQGHAKGVNELRALSPYEGPTQPGAPDQLRRRLNREERMRETSQAALGGPATAENLADMGAGPAGIPDAMSMVTSGAHGNPVGFVRGAYEMSANLLKGESEKQRMAIARALLANEPTAAQALADRLTAYEARRQRGLRGAYGE